MNRDIDPLPQQRQWWVQRWLELLDSYRFKKRLERARTYARSGHVLNIEFSSNQVKAQVQGSEAQPYEVSLAIASFTEADWEDIITSISAKALFLAQLLAGEMPPEIEEVFTANGLSLFPFNLSDINSHCTCPDPVNPCKHIGAVYYQLGDRFSEDPFILLQLRGKTKQAIILALRQLRQQEVDLTTATLPPSPPTPEPSSTPSNPNQADFWSYREPLDPSLVKITPPESHKTPLDVLGPLPHREAELIEKYLQQVYQSVPRRILEKNSA
ncbi:hypothetical protein [Gloeocapsa sp. PCC 73106]|uniref:SWIM zinc finger family protein n=1 Tax=Gloeocapsa sp. PCC 73106 TaxID=102232 RepID=UPI0002AC0DC0|nr:hypothetical protein [Gloeocapsa sp. PCC 73106]ELR96338.1 hypothetical protein GLO73106DRAFT_00001280 [Gloeocapsa sp. PCC 73106]